MADKKKQSGQERAFKNMSDFNELMQQRRNNMMNLRNEKGQNDSISIIDAIEQTENLPEKGLWETLKFGKSDESIIREGNPITKPVPEYYFSGGSARSPIGSMVKSARYPTTAEIVERKYAPNQMLELNDLTGQHHGNFGPEWGDKENPDGRPISMERDLKEVKQTKLSPAEELKFQRFIRSTPWYREYISEYREEPDLNTPDYDYRKAWKNGIVPQRDPNDGNRYHWGSSTSSGEMLKSPDHPTAWKEQYMRATGKNPDEAGVTKEQAAPLLNKPRQKDAPVEKNRPFEQYDKFRDPGFWRGDEVTPNAKPATRIERKSSVEPKDIPLTAAKERLAMEGRKGDTELAHVNPEEKMLLAARGGAGTVNPSTGMAEFYPNGKEEDDDSEEETSKMDWLAEADIAAALPDKAVIAELKAVRDMIRDAKESGKIEDKNTLKQITKRHKKLLSTLIDSALESEDDSEENGNKVPLKKAKARVAMEGRNGDTEVAMVSKSDKKFLKARGGAGTKNPSTGMPEFFEGSTGADSHGDSSTGASGGETGGNPGGSASGVGDNDYAGYSTLSDVGPVGPVGPAPNEQGWAPEEAGMYQGAPKTSPTYDKSNNWGLGIGDASALAGTGTGITGALNYAAQVGIEPAMAGISNSISNLSFADVAGALAGGVAGLVTSGLVSPVAGPLAGFAASSLASKTVGNAATTAMSTSARERQLSEALGQPVSFSDKTTSPNATAPGTAGVSTGSPGEARNTGDNLGYDRKTTPLASPTVTPLLVQPTTTVADETPTPGTGRGIMIPRIGYPRRNLPMASTV